jgi:hypothetical protein
MMTPSPSDAELLVKFEQDKFPEHYKEYYGARRQNFFATIQSSPSLWAAFMLLDRIWIRELENMRTTIDTGRMFPLILFMNAHAKSRIGLELAFSACLPEAYSLFRDAIESVAHGHRLFAEPDLQKLWVSRDSDPEALRRFNEEFWYSKEEKLFDGIPELHRFWKQFSDWGSHTNPVSIVSRFVIEETPKHVTWRLNYTGVRLETLIPALFTTLLAFNIMEKVLFHDCHDRLKLDPNLTTMKRQFEGDKETLRERIKREFTLSPSANKQADGPPTQ